MLFNSIEYLLFLPLTFLVYWSIKRRSIQNLFIVAASYFFYACWDWHFLSLIVITTLSSYAAGCAMDRPGAGRQMRFAVFLASIALNLFILGVFKYYDFFSRSFSSLLALFGISADYPTLNIILPVGISFYTFQAVGYTIDVYRRQMAACRSLVDFSAFICFFPQLVAGPIEPASHLLPQLRHSRSFDYHNAVTGMRLILWGLFKKMVVADNCAITVDMVWSDYTGYSSGMLFVASLLFTVQIYCDFSAYSEIAVGSAKLLGIELLDNFKTPYFSTSIPEFWRRWHITLMNWFQTYIYIPLGGSRMGRFVTLRNVFIVFLFSGLWHGANFTFIVWGLFHALLSAPYVLLGIRSRRASEAIAVTWKQVPSLVLTFMLVSLGWIIFRAPDLQSAAGYFSHMLTSGIAFADFSGIKALGVSILCLAVEWIQRNRACPLDFGFSSRPAFSWARAAAYYVILLLIVALSVRQDSFIYFQF